MSRCAHGTMFVTPGEQVYEGQIAGEHCKGGDIAANVVRLKNLANMRSSTKEETITLKAPRLRRESDGDRKPENGQKWVRRPPIMRPPIKAKR